MNPAPTNSGSQTVEAEPSAAARPKGKGFPDLPVEKSKEDKLEVSPYVESLTEFIAACDTPMTIAIQGDWGVGKTSIMNMIKEKLLARDVLHVWVNTWQFSQFDLQSSLPLSFLAYFLDQLKDKTVIEGLLKSFRSIAKAVSWVPKMAATAVVEKVAGEVVTEQLFTGATDIVDLAKYIEGLRDKIKDAVRKRLGSANKQRLIVFIDDLDRLQPEMAVELLELIKVFIDIPNCVFILAVDYSIVIRGLSKKYGEQISEAKGRSFFDKMIQLPFNVPTSLYEIKKYIQDFFSDADIVAEEESIDVYSGLLKNSIGLNPRGMKRLFNSFILLKKVAKRKDLFKEEADHRQKLLFASLCLQMAYDEVYDYLLKKISNEDLKEETFQTLMNREALRKQDEIMKHHKGNEDSACQIIASFMETLHGLLDKDRTGKLDSDEIELFESTILFSAITQRESQAEPSDRKRKSPEFRRWDTWEPYAEFMREGFGGMLPLMDIIRNDIENTFAGKVKLAYSPTYVRGMVVGPGSKDERSFLGLDLKKKFVRISILKGTDSPIPPISGAVESAYGGGAYFEIKLTRKEDYTNQVKEAIREAFVIRLRDIEKQEGPNSHAKLPG